MHDELLSLFRESTVPSTGLEYQASDHGGRSRAEVDESN